MNDIFIRVGLAHIGALTLLAFLVTLFSPGA